MSALDLGTCDSCDAPFVDTWTALGGVARGDALCVCDACAPILRVIDALVEQGRLSPAAAARTFAARRWPR